MIALTMIYYVVLPAFDDMSLYSANTRPNQWLFFLSADIFFACILLAFKRVRPGRFTNWNKYFSESNVQLIAVVLFVIAMICYVPFRGFRTSISATDATITAARTGFVSYFIDLISLFVAACCLAFVGLKNKERLSLKKRTVVLTIFYFTFVMFIVGGFRYRIVILILAMATVYHLYPVVRKIRYIVVVPVAIAAYLGFAVMDSTRTYGHGINLEAVKALTLRDASKGAGESNDVFCFSIAAIDTYSQKQDFIGLEPVSTAVLMPIPRALFPGKPDGQYLKEIQIAVIGNDFAGAAFLVFVEAYASCGILGVILYGLFIGWVCKKIWSNYRNNRNSIGAVLLLALMNGFCYTWISRGYMASAFNDFIYFVVLPFWLTAFLKKIKKTR